MVVEDSSCLDTNAIILKGTTVLTYKPRLLDRPFSGSLAGIEVTYWTPVIPSYLLAYEMSFVHEHIYVPSCPSIGVLLSAG